MQTWQINRPDGLKRQSGLVDSLRVLVVYVLTSRRVTLITRIASLDWSVFAERMSGPWKLSNPRSKSLRIAWI